MKKKEYVFSTNVKRLGFCYNGVAKQFELYTGLYKTTDAAEAKHIRETMKEYVKELTPVETNKKEETNDLKENGNIVKELTPVETNKKEETKDLKENGNIVKEGSL